MFVAFTAHTLLLFDSKYRSETFAIDYTTYTIILLNMNTLHQKIKETCIKSEEFKVYLTLPFGSKRIAIIRKLRCNLNSIGNHCGKYEIGINVMR